MKLLDLLRPAILLLLVFTLLLGLVYPALTAILAGALFSKEAAGSLVTIEGSLRGSVLIGQNFGAPGYFWPRPSATPGGSYNAASSGATNLSPGNPALIENAAARLDSLYRSHPKAQGPVPIDLVMASGSGLDPHISVAAAYWQAKRVAKARGYPEEYIRELVRSHAEPRQFGLFGEAVINVLLLNLALDREDGKR